MTWLLAESNQNSGMIWIRRWLQSYRCMPRGYDDLVNPRHTIYIRKRRIIRTGGLIAPPTSEPGFL